MKEDDFIGGLILTLIQEQRGSGLGLVHLNHKI